MLGASVESIILEIPSKIVSQMKLPPGRAQRLVMQELALHLYQEGIISSGQSAYLLKINRMAFERLLAEHCIPIHCDPEELERDISFLDSAL
jgi:predicted HTH domain antitoxin